MSKYNVGDKFLIEIDEVLNNGLFITYRMNELGTLFNSFTLDKLERYQPVNIEEIKKKAYEDGMCDAWEIIKKITVMPGSGGFSLDELDNIFGSSSPGYISLHYTPQEAKDKIEEYEKEQEEKKKIHVGDVIVCGSYECTGVVSMIRDDYLYIIFSDGSCGYFQKKDINKTGQTLDLSNIFNLKK